MCAVGREMGVSVPVRRGPGLSRRGRESLTARPGRRSARRAGAGAPEVTAVDAHACRPGGGFEAGWKKAPLFLSRFDVVGFICVVTALF